MSSIDQLGGLGAYGGQLKTALFIGAATPYIIGFAIMFIIGLVGLIAGSGQDEETINVQTQKTQGVPPVDQKGSPLPRLANCPSCGQPMIFIAEHKRWYCPKENYYI